MGFRPQWRCWSCDFVNFTEDGDGRIRKFDCQVCQFSRTTVAREIVWFFWKREEGGLGEKVRFRYRLAVGGEEVEMVEEEMRKHNRKIREKKTGVRDCVDSGIDG